MSDLTAVSDQELITLLREGNEAAYTSIYRRYFKLLYLHALRKLGDQEMAKDIVQELFTVVWAKREEITQNNLAAYLYTSIKNRIIDNFSRKEVSDRYTRSFQSFAVGYSDTTDHLVREHDLNSLIEQEIQALPPRMREIFELSRKTYLSHKEIADQLKISEHTVSVQITKALKILRDKLSVFAFLFLFFSS